MNEIEENDINDSIQSILEQNYAMLKPRILVFGVGGAGTNAVNNMYNSDLTDVDFIIANTDAQALLMSPVKKKIQLGPKTTKGLGAGTVPEVGKTAAEEVEVEIAKYLDGAHMIFITAGMGGGTGTGAAPVIARMAKERDILTTAVVTKPFSHEGNQKMYLAEQGIEELKKYVDTLIIVPNQNLYKIANEQTTLEESFKKVDHVLKLGVKGITDLITQPGLVNLDFADIRTVMKKMGKSMMGMGEASGENRAIRAVEEAISNPLLDNSSIKGAKGIVVNITASPDFTLYEYEAATRKIKEEADENAIIITGNALNKDLVDTVRISVFATGIEDQADPEIIRNNIKLENPNTNVNQHTDYDDEDYDESVENTTKKIINDQEEYFDISSKTKSLNLEDEYNNIRRQALNQYLHEMNNNQTKQKESSTKRFFGNLFGNNSSKNEKKDGIKLKTDDDYDDINIDTYSSELLKKKK